MGGLRSTRTDEKPPHKPPKINLEAPTENEGGDSPESKLDDASSGDDESTSHSDTDTRGNMDAESEAQKTSNIGNILNGTTSTPLKQESTEILVPLHPQLGPGN